MSSDEAHKMRIRTQYILSIAVFAIILAVISVSVVITNRQVNLINNQAKTAANIQTGASTLAYISNDYFLNKQNAQLLEWQTQFSLVSNEVSNLNSNNLEQKTQINTVNTDLQNLGTIFNYSVAYVESIPASQNGAVHPILKLDTNNLDVQNQALAFDASVLSASFDSQANQVKQTNTLLIFALLAAFALYFIAVYFIFYRQTFRSIAKLHDGTKIVGSGNLDYTISSKSNDEIGELSQAFNQMTSNLKTANKQLKDSERLASIGATAGMVGHDIRNPLQAIISDVFLAKTELDSFPDSEGKKNALESLQEIEKNTDYINKIVQDLQDYARPLNPKPEEADLKLIITKLFEKNNMPDNIELRIKVENSAEKISTDTYYINRIMYNLINNAVQAMPNGGTLTVHAFKESKDLVMTVKDTGVGIPKEIQGKMFTPMFTTKSKGQGFGLPVVKRMTESLGGTVTFESEVGKGTTFTVSLPLTK
jgi:signal transduction histidine kinase